MLANPGKWHWSLKTRDPFSHVALPNQLSSKRNVPDASLRCLLTHRDTSLRNFSPRGKKKNHDEVRTWSASASYVEPPRGPFPSPPKKMMGLVKRSRKEITSHKDECFQWSLHRLHCLACCAYAFASDAVHYYPIRSLMMLLLLRLSVEKRKKEGDSTFDDLHLHSRGCSMCASSQSRGSSVEALNSIYPMQLLNHRMLLTLGLSRSHFWLQLQLVALRCSTFAPERLIGISLET